MHQIILHFSQIETNPTSRFHIPWEFLNPWKYFFCLFTLLYSRPRSITFFLHFFFSFFLVIFFFFFNKIHSFRYKVRARDSNISFIHMRTRWRWFSICKIDLLINMHCSCKLWYWQGLTQIVKFPRSKWFGFRMCWKDFSPRNFDINNYRKERRMSISTSNNKHNIKNSIHHYWNFILH